MDRTYDFYADAASGSAERCAQAGRKHGSVTVLIKFIQTRQLRSRQRQQKEKERQRRFPFPGASDGGSASKFGFILQFSVSQGRMILLQ